MLVTRKTCAGVYPKSESEEEGGREGRRGEREIERERERAAPKGSFILSPSDYEGIMQMHAEG